MLTFKKGDPTPDMDPCRKKPITLGCVRIQESFRVEKPKGTMEGNPGDYLVRDSEGELYIVDTKTFHETYDLLTHDFNVLREFGLR